MATEWVALDDLAETNLVTLFRRWQQLAWLVISHLLVSDSRIRKEV